MTLRMLTVTFLVLVSWAANAEPVTIDTFVRAETDRTLRGQAEQIGFGTFLHFRQLAPLDNQPVIRQNQDTLYSTAIIDLSSPVTVTLPDTGGRYMSLHVVNQDHYMFVLTEPGDHVLSEEIVGTRYAGLNVRTFMDPSDPEDIVAANVAQDGLRITGGGKGPYEAPDWDLDQLRTARQALNELSKLGFDTTYAFGMPDQTKPIDHLVGAAVGWGGLPRESAYYEIASVSDTSGTPHAVTVEDAPVDAFWSITVYNAEGYIGKNKLGVYSLNNVTAKPNEDGSHTIHFGGCEDGRVNCIPIMEGWNYTARMYEPREEILNGDWVFPTPEPVE